MLRLCWRGSEALQHRCFQELATANKNEVVKQSWCFHAAHFCMIITLLVPKICIFFCWVFIRTVAGEFACLRSPVSTLEEIISSLMKAIFKCLQMFSA